MLAQGTSYDLDLLYPDDIEIGREKPVAHGSFKQVEATLEPDEGGKTRLQMTDTGKSLIAQFRGESGYEEPVSVRYDNLPEDQTGLPSTREEVYRVIQAVDR
jgi:hypothetical protein